MFTLSPGWAELCCGLTLAHEYRVPLGTRQYFSQTGSVAAASPRAEQHLRSRDSFSVVTGEVMRGRRADYSPRDPVPYHPEAHTQWSPRSGQRHRLHHRGQLCLLHDGAFPPNRAELGLGRAEEGKGDAQTQDDAQSCTQTQLCRTPPPALDAGTIPKLTETLCWQSRRQDSSCVTSGGKGTA